MKIPPPIIKLYVVTEDHNSINSIEAEVHAKTYRCLYRSAVTDFRIIIPHGDPAVFLSAVAAAKANLARRAKRLEQLKQAVVNARAAVQHAYILLNSVEEVAAP
ncbi:hypothetical protein UFOVP1329_33 [uncultured Caudovirales phage]|uniref:Uncharacterized protein n=1 Tax=uncultured Caudovirales phage TaxID=2100421 RepID=A0A6J5SRT4_9CAUD|nr:hypothetical protein UFOVP1150_14 [uncultured Caudovirales phage]CAB4199265.1 hypothetical protein UFOVP1329_33 [uncultured Caudovirales phage]CAB4218208.1 hypothetical protein UFOVP1595_3 [uncultured Caudovirales phage]